ncbi:putative phage abortive infection protein [Qipengyuania xiapuensis]|uniref:Phage abortive infection protein n=1 Tax=Qipengyuania xiapuensis TaxID=2867236 RepID=A0ABX8ZVZ4_9SPHN|nr:putative phage abortive infection protein [Qipengyuania xiapuensis]QZD93188.1 putative phage abortive infection protein [Qipengyuania xiapuensis]
MKLWIGPAVGLFLVTILVGILAASFIDGAFSTLGEFGDFVGGLANPLLALMGYLALLYTIKVQTRELELSRKELELTREELDRSATALEEQVATSERQRLSQSFFDLFEMYKSVVSEISYGMGDSRVVGKAAFEKFIFGFSPSGFDSNKTWSIERVQRAHDGQNARLGNYFRIIYRLLSFLNENGNDAEFFADMFRAQLTTAELHLLFFNCVSDVGSPMQKYAAKFELFDNMPVPHGDGFEAIAEKIDPKAFGENDALLSLI